VERIRGGDAPFAGAGVQTIARFADQAIDISDEWIAAEAPEAIEAILDLHYPDGRHRDDFEVARWRLQLIAELGVGRLVRQQQAGEDNNVRKLRSVV
jgi:hypothetical protein